jgi:hypothetical protein
MNKVTKKKLALRTEMVRKLQLSELEAAHGGRINQSRVSQCDCPTFMCDYTEGGCTF